MNETIKRLEEISKGWGGKFKEIKSYREAFHIEKYGVSFVECDSFVGFCHYDKTLYFETKSHWVDIIHGMGHIFALKSRKVAFHVPEKNVLYFIRGNTRW